MNNLQEILSIVGDISIILGCYFIISGALGLLRLKDFFTRSHPAGINDSTSLPLILFGLMLKIEPSLITIKLALVMVFSMITAATATHALTKAAIFDIEPLGKKDGDYESIKPEK